MGARTAPDEQTVTRSRSQSYTDNYQHNNRHPIDARDRCPDARSLHVLRATQGAILDYNEGSVEARAETADTSQPRANHSGAWISRSEEGTYGESKELISSNI
jgi:hypothetical protein